MRQPRLFKIIDSKKYKYIVIMPVVNTSDWAILIDNKLRYGGVQFSSQEIEEKLTYYSKNLNIVEQKLRGRRSNGIKKTRGSTP